MFYTLLIIAFCIIMLALFMTQVVMPFHYGTPFFPLFRKKNELSAKVVQAEVELTETAELVGLQEQLDDLNRRKANLEQK